MGLDRSPKSMVETVIGHFELMSTPNRKHPHQGGVEVEIHMVTESDDVLERQTLKIVKKRLTFVQSPSGAFGDVVECLRAHDRSFNLTSW